jgi:hypothetical protein
MHLRRLVTLNGLVAFVFGTTAFLWPSMVAGLYAAPQGFEVFALIRFLGVATMMYGALLWWAGSVAEGRSAESLSRLLLGAHVVGFAIILVQQIAIWSSPAGWLTMAAFATFALLYARADSLPQASLSTAA